MATVQVAEILLLTTEGTECFQDYFLCDLHVLCGLF